MLAVLDITGVHTSKVFNIFYLILTIYYKLLEAEDEGKKVEA